MDPWKPKYIQEWFVSINRNHLLKRVFFVWYPIIPSELQGVPKVRSSNLMHYNFWSKLCFYMKFLEDVYFSTEYMHSEFQ